MKTKIILLTIYLVFLGVALSQWLTWSSLSKVEKGPPGTYQRLQEQAASITTIERSKSMLKQMISGLEAKEDSVLWGAQRGATYILFSICSTLPLAAYVAYGLRKEKKEA